MIIYKAENKINGKVYIGKTIYSLNDRKQDHIRRSKRNNTNIIFQRAIKKYGADNFEWSILCETNIESKLNVLEKFYIAAYKKITGIYNMTEGGEGLSGMSFSESHKHKISESHKGKIISDETRKKIGETSKGRKHSDSTKEKMSNSQKGKFFSEETRKKIGEANKKRIYTEEMRKKQSDRQKGKFRGAENPFYGRKHTDETKKKISLSRKLKRENNEN